MVYFGGWFGIHDWGYFLSVAAYEVFACGVAPVCDWWQCVLFLCRSVWLHFRYIAINPPCGGFIIKGYDMRKFFANLVAGFVWNKNKRRSVRNKILRKVKIEVKKIETPEDFKKRYVSVKQKWREVCGENTPLRPGRFAEYDLIFGIGSTCHVTTILGEHKLRRFSTPLDWTGGVAPVGWYGLPDVHRDSRFNEKIDMLISGFRDAFVFDNFKLVCADGLPKREHHIVADVKNNIRYIHHFPMDKSIESYFPEFLDTMKRRTDRLMKSIELSGKILIVWIHRISDQTDILDKVVSDEEAVLALNKLKQAYPDKEFDIVFFEADGTKAEYEFDKITVTDGVYKIRSNHYLEEDAYRFKYKYRNMRVQPIVAEALDNIALTDLLKDVQTKAGWLTD